ncbi:MAG: D-alanyl-D-alanine endopeptidase [Candidatus Accumulibacter sp.]|jgi:D-alanyl-D-alanine endopeptidase (penicillin-binding protein 7)|nr:D-alanyl-D-alanine endopeptidase [Accumulibacter sp.]
MLGSFKPVLVLFAALGVSLMPLGAVDAAQKSNAGSSSISRAKQASVIGKKKSGASPVARAGGKAPAKSKVSARAARKSRLARAAPATGARAHDERLLDVKSGAALVVEQTGGGALFQKNAGVVVPIASITKLMTAMVVLDGWPDLQAAVSITEDDVDYLRGSRSRLHLGTAMTRETALLLALMSSENRAAHALARHYPGGMPAFLAAMNRKARSLGMRNTRFEDPTGLSRNNVSTARDLAKMVVAAYRYPLIREFSTMEGATVEVAGRPLEFHNTNPLVGNSSWNVGLSKTGFTHEAGKCLVMQARVANRPVVIVLLDSTGKLTRVGDANRIRRWMETVLASHDTRAQRASFAPPGARPG